MSAESSDFEYSTRFYPGTYGGVEEGAATVCYRNPCFSLSSQTAAGDAPDLRSVSSAQSCQLQVMLSQPPHVATPQKSASGGHGAATSATLDAGKPSPAPTGCSRAPTEGGDGGQRGRQEQQQYDVRHREDQEGQEQQQHHHQYHQHLCHHQRGRSVGGSNLPESPGDPFRIAPGNTSAMSVADYSPATPTDELLGASSQPLRISPAAGSSTAAAGAYGTATAEDAPTTPTGPPRAAAAETPATPAGVCRGMPEGTPAALHNPFLKVSADASAFSGEAPRTAGATDATPTAKTTPTSAAFARSTAAMGTSGAVSSPNLSPRSTPSFHSASDTAHIAPWDSDWLLGDSSPLKYDTGKAPGPGEPPQPLPYDARAASNEGLLPYKYDGGAPPVESTRGPPPSNPCAGGPFLQAASNPGHSYDAVVHDACGSPSGEPQPCQPWQGCVAEILSSVASLDFVDQLLRHVGQGSQRAGRRPGGPGAPELTSRHSAWAIRASAVVALGALGWRREGATVTGVAAELSASMCMACRVSALTAAGGLLLWTWRAAVGALLLTLTAATWPLLMAVLGECFGGRQGLPSPDLWISTVVVAAHICVTLWKLSASLLSSGHLQQLLALLLAFTATFGQFHCTVHRCSCGIGRAFRRHAVAAGMLAMAAALLQSWLLKQRALQSAQDGQTPDPGVLTWFEIYLKCMTPTLPVMLVSRAVDQAMRNLAKLGASPLCDEPPYLLSYGYLAWALGRFILVTEILYFTGSARLAGGINAALLAAYLACYGARLGASCLRLQSRRGGGYNATGSGGGYNATGSGGGYNATGSGGSGTGAAESPSTITTSLFVEAIWVALGLLLSLGLSLLLALLPAASSPAAPVLSPPTPPPPAVASAPTPQALLPCVLTSAGPLEAAVSGGYEHLAVALRWLRHAQPLLWSLSRAMAVGLVLQGLRLGTSRKARAHLRRLWSSGNAGPRDHWSLAVQMSLLFIAFMGGSVLLVSLLHLWSAAAASWVVIAAGGLELGAWLVLTVSIANFEPLKTRPATDVPVPGLPPELG